MKCHFFTQQRNFAKVFGDIDKEIFLPGLRSMFLEVYVILTATYKLTHIIW